MLNYEFRIKEKLLHLVRNDW